MRRTYPSRRTGTAVYRTPSRVAWARRPRVLSAPVAQSVAVAGAAGVARGWATAGAVSVTDVVVAVNVAAAWARAGSGAVLAVREALVVGRAGVGRLSAGAGRLSTGASAVLAGGPGVARLSAAAGGVLAVRSVVLPGVAGVAYARGFGSLTAVQGAEVRGRAGVILARPGSGAVVTTDSPVVTAGGAMRVRVRRMSSMGLRVREVVGV